MLAELLDKNTFIETSNEFHSFMIENDGELELGRSKKGKIKARITSARNFYHPYRFEVEGENMFEIYVRANAEFKILTPYL